MATTKVYEIIGWLKDQIKKGSNYIDKLAENDSVGELAQKIAIAIQDGDTRPIEDIVLEINGQPLSDEDLTCLINCLQTEHGIGVFEPVGDQALMTNESVYSPKHGVGMVIDLAEGNATVIFDNGETDIINEKQLHRKIYNTNLYGTKILEFANRNQGNETDQAFSKAILEAATEIRTDEEGRTTKEIIASLYESHKDTLLEKGSKKYFTEFTRIINEESPDVRKKALEQQLSSIAGVDVEIGILSKDKFSVIYDGDDKAPAEKIKNFFGTQVAWDKDFEYDKDGECTYGYFTAKQPTTENLQPGQSVQFIDKESLINCGMDANIAHAVKEAYGTVKEYRPETGECDIQLANDNSDRSLIVNCNQYMFVNEGYSESNSGVSWLLSETLTQSTFDQVTSEIMAEVDSRMKAAGKTIPDEDITNAAYDKILGKYGISIDDYKDFAEQMSEAKLNESDGTKHFKATFECNGNSGFVSDIKGSKGGNQFDITIDTVKEINKGYEIHGTFKSPDSSWTNDELTNELDTTLGDVINSYTGKWPDNMNIDISDKALENIINESVSNYTKKQILNIIKDSDINREGGKKFIEDDITDAFVKDFNALVDKLKKMNSEFDPENTEDYLGEVDDKFIEGFNALTKDYLGRSILESNNPEADKEKFKEILNNAGIAFDDKDLDALLAELGQGTNYEEVFDKQFGVLFESHSGTLTESKLLTDGTYKDPFGNKFELKAGTELYVGADYGKDNSWVKVDIDGKEKVIAVPKTAIKENANEKTVKGYSNLSKLFTGPDLRYALNLADKSSGVVAGIDGKNYNVVANGGGNGLYDDNRTWIVTSTNESKSKPMNKIKEGVDPTSINVGSKVKHSKYGEGTVTKINPYDCVVDFGKKKDVTVKYTSLKESAADKFKVYFYDKSGAMIDTKEESDKDKAIELAKGNKDAEYAEVYPPNPNAVTGKPIWTNKPTSESIQNDKNGKLETFMKDPELNKFSLSYDGTDTLEFTKKEGNIMKTDEDLITCKLNDSGIEVLDTVTAADKLSVMVDENFLNEESMNEEVDSSKLGNKKQLFDKLVEKYKLSDVLQNNLFSVLMAGDSDDEMAGAIAAITSDTKDNIVELMKAKNEDSSSITESKLPSFEEFESNLNSGRKLINESLGK